MATVSSFSLPPIVYKPIAYTPVQRNQPTTPPPASESVSTDLVLNALVQDLGHQLAPIRFGSRQPGQIRRKIEEVVVVASLGESG